MIGCFLASTAAVDARNGKSDNEYEGSPIFAGRFQGWPQKYRRKPILMSRKCRHAFRRFLLGPDGPRYSKH